MTTVVAAKVCELEAVSRYRAPLILEGGSIHVDGLGTCLTTEECLLNPNRNPDLAREEIEGLLGAYLGIEKVIWLPRGVFADETDGHVDNLVCFTRPGRVLLTWSEEPGDPQTEISRQARRVLESATDAQGRQLEVGLLPSPGPLSMTPEEASGIASNPHAQARRAGDRLAASYVNFFIASTSVVYPRPRPALRRRGGCRARRGVSRPPGRGSAGSGDPLGWREHPLHHAAGPPALNVTKGGSAPGARRGVRAAPGRIPRRSTAALR